MTTDDFESRIRKIEDWCKVHDERCNARDERTMSAIEAVRKSVEKAEKAGTATDERIASLRDEMHAVNAETNSRISKLEVKLAFFAGTGAATGGAIGAALSQMFGG